MSTVQLLLFELGKVTYGHPCTAVFVLSGLFCYLDHFLHPLVEKNEGQVFFDIKKKEF